MKLSRIFLSSALVLLVFPQLTLACAVAITENSNETGWAYTMPTQAQGFISYDNGIEKLVMSHQFSTGGTKGVAIITPIPGGPSDIKLDVLAKIPQLNGQEISKTASAEALNTAGIVGLSQLWTIVPSVLTRLAQGMAGSAPIMQEQGTKFAASSGIASRTMQQALPDVRVFNQLDKNGITSEVVTARTANGLYDYLTGKGLTVPSGSIGILKPYIGGNFSFVVSWVSATNARIHGCQEKPVTMSYSAVHPQIGASCAKGIFVSFPTKDLYYPLIPSGAYSDTAHSETIRVIGHVSPKLYASCAG